MTDLRKAAEDALHELERLVPKDDWAITVTLRAALEQEKKWDLIAEMHNVEEQDMTDQPEALFLADALEVALDTVISGDVDRRAAAELRRLHKENAELLAALKSLIDTRHKHFINNEIDGMHGWDEKALAAIAKAEDKP